MKLSELKRLVDLYASETENKDANLDVVITLDEPSVGARAKSDIKGVYQGFDWEHGQLRIEPTEKLCRKGRSKDNELEMYGIRYIYDRKTTTKYHCPMCSEILPKAANYCIKCGQKVRASDKIKYEYDYRTKEGNKS